MIQLDIGTRPVLVTIALVPQFLLHPLDAHPMLDSIAHQLS